MKRARRREETTTQKWTFDKVQRMSWSALFIFVCMD